MVGYWSQYYGDVPIDTPGYGLQSVDAKGYYNEDYYGAVAFSQINYWNDGNGNLLSPYNQNGASYDGNPYPYVYNSNSSIYQYISGENGYINKLKEMGVPSTITGRLLTYEEADAVQNVEDGGNSIIFNDTNYWLGSAYNEVEVWNVYGDHFGVSDGGDGSCLYYDVRQVIEINTSDIG